MCLQNKQMNCAISSQGSVSKADRTLTVKESGHNFVSASPSLEMKKILKVEVLPIKESGADFVRTRLNQSFVALLVIAVFVVSTEWEQTSYGRLGADMD